MKTPPLAGVCLNRIGKVRPLGQQIDEIDARIKEIDAKLTAAHKASEVSQRLVTMPGVGPVTALTIGVEIDPAMLESGRHLAAWAGLTQSDGRAAAVQG
jgi:transposase